MTRVPAGVNWCASTGPVSPGKPSGYSGVRVIDGERLSACNNAFFTENPYLEWGFWEATISFGLSTNELGELTDVCVWDGNLGNPDRYVSCIATALKTSGLALPPHQKKTPWEVIIKMNLSE